MTTDATIAKYIQPTSWLGLASAGDKPTTTSLITAPLIGARGHIPRVFPAGSNTPAVLVVVDGGSSTLKIAVLVVDSDNTVAPRLLMRQVDVCYVIAEQRLRSTQAKTFQVNGGTAIHIGNPLVNTVQYIPTGTTAERMANTSYRDILFAAITDSLIVAGYQAASMPIYLGYVVPIEDYIDDDLIPETKSALESLSGQTITVDRRDQNGTQRWSLQIVSTLAALQTHAIFYAMQRGVSGETVLEGITTSKVLDIGFEYIQMLSVNFEDDTLSVSGEAIERGMILITESLIESVQEKYHIVINDEQAKHALVTNRCVFPDGTVQDITECVDEAVDKAGSSVLEPIEQEALTDDTALIVYGGGGAVKLAAAIEQRIELEEWREGSTLVLPASIASWANIIGGYASIAHQLMGMPPLELQSTRQYDLLQLHGSTLKDRIDNLAMVTRQRPASVHRRALKIGLELLAVVDLGFVENDAIERQRTQGLRALYLELQNYLARRGELPPSRW